MAFPVSEKILTPVLIASAALLIAAAPPSALAPDLPVTCAPDNQANAEAAAPAAPDAAQQALTAHLSKRFFIAPGATEEIVAAAHSAAAEVNLDPLLVLAVIAIESRFNPIAESVMGAKGLMQIIPGYHLDKLRAAGGEDRVFDPESNIHVGARILQEYVYRGGTLEAGLQQYNGASRDSNAYYAQGVMAERERLEQVVRTRGLLTIAATGQGG
jgi:soluble lytic murein transglycosylase-like protein